MRQDVLALARDSSRRAGVNGTATGGGLRRKPLGESKAQRRNSDS